MQLNAYEDAIASYSEVIARDSTYGPAYGNRGNAYNILQKPEKAIADLEAATQIFAEQGNTKAEQVSRLKLKELKQDLKTDPAHENSNDFTNSSAPP